jgi:hypothetical protein
MDWVTTVFDWMPLIGGWSFFFQLLVIWATLLTAIGIGFAYADDPQSGLEGIVGGIVGYVSILVFYGTLGLAGLGAVASITKPADPVPAQTAPIVGAAEMDRETFQIRGEDDRRATLVLYGHREDDSFEIRGYRVRVEGGAANEAAGWSISTIKGGRRGAVYSVGSTAAIRADGNWQWGEVDQRGVFSSGQTYGLYFRFKGGNDASMPVSF